MNTTEQNRELIECYMDDSLSPDERTAFETRLTTDVSLKSEFDTRLKLAQAWREARTYEAVKNEIRQSARKEAVRSKQRKLQLAAAAVLLIAIAIPATQFLVSLPGKPVRMAQQSESRNADSMTAVPAVKTPGETAATGTVSLLQLLTPRQDTLISPSGPVTFRWSPPLAETSLLIVEELETGKILFQKEIPVWNDHIELPAETLKPGSYRWYLKNHPSVEKFSITSSGRP